MNPILTQIDEVVGEWPIVQTFFWLVALALAALLVNFIVKFALLRLVNKLLGGVTAINGPEVVQSRVLARLANAAPMVVISAGIMRVPGLPVDLAKVIQNVANAVSILVVAMAISAGLSLFERIWRRRAGPSGRSVKGYVQVAVLIIYALAAILMIAAIIDRSPLILLSGLGALTAVLLLVFQDTILSFVASIQVSSTGMVKVGDWIQMPSMNADGTVVDLALYSVTVQNFDMTLTTFPIRKLVSDPFTNWRGMTESGARRIKRAISIDQGSIHFLAEDEIARLKALKTLNGYVDRKSREIEDWNAELGEAAKVAANRRRMTNIGMFRAYVEHYLRSHRSLRQDMTLLVRQLPPGSDGLPIEIYCFTATTAWAEYEAIQADIFDHLLAILPEFGLALFQSPTGQDFTRLAMVPRRAPRQTNALMDRGLAAPDEPGQAGKATAEAMR